jgi:hypothetical protein
MHRFLKRKADQQIVMGAMMFWGAAPSLPVVAAYLARLGLTSVRFQRQVLEATALLVALVLVALSLWGAALIRARLKASPLKDFGLVAPPALGLILAASAAAFAKWMASQLLDDWGGAYGNYGIFLLIWAALIAQQLKYFWEHSLEAWETRRGDFTPFLRPFDAYPRRLARKALADRQAKAWISRRRQGWTFADEKAFQRWRRHPGKAAALRRQGHGISPLLIVVVTISLAATVGSYAYHSGHLSRPITAAARPPAIKVRAPDVAPTNSARAVSTRSDLGTR